MKETKNSKKSEISNEFESKSRTKNKPFRILTRGRIKIIIWENIRSDGKSFNTFEILNIFKDSKTNEWKSSKTFNYYHIKDLYLAIDELNKYGY